MATYKFLYNKNIKSTPVANVFIEKYMPVANATFVKVYLYGLLRCFSGSNEIDNEKFAKALNILESDVVNAWLYWESVGVVKLLRKDNNASNDFDIEFIDLTIKQYETTQRITLNTRPSYAPKEVAAYIDQNAEIQYMFKYYEEKSGKTLSSSDINILYSFYDWLHLPVEVIIMLIEYCYSIQKTNIRYIEKVAINWSDLGINSIDKTEQYLKELEHKNSLIYQVKKCLGLTDRALAESESTYIREWTEKMAHSIEMIQFAYNLTVLNTGKLSFPYLNSILKAWHTHGIKTVEQAKDEINQHKQSNKKKFSTENIAQTTKRKPNKFINFTQREYDFEEIERLAQQRTINNLKRK